jgi:hypothetical protein
MNDATTQLNALEALRGKAAKGGTAHKLLGEAMKHRTDSRRVADALAAARAEGLEVGDVAKVCGVTLDPPKEEGPSGTKTAGPEGSNLPIKDSKSKFDVDVEAEARFLEAIANFYPRKSIWKRDAKGKPFLVHGGVYLRPSDIRAHLSGAEGRTGLGFIEPGESTCRAALIDIDDHEKTLDFESGVVPVALKLAREGERRGLKPWLNSSSSGRGVHVRLFWSKPQDAYSVRALLREVLDACELKDGTKGLQAGEVEIFPKQDHVPRDGFGNMAWLPFNSESQALDEQTGEFIPIDDAIFKGVPTSSAVPKLEKPERVPVAAVAPTDDAELQRLANAVEAIPNPGRDYDLLRNICSGIHHATGGSDWGRALMHKWAQRSSIYDAAIIDGKILEEWLDKKDGGADRPITQQWIYAQARKHGWQDPAALNGLIPLEPEIDEDAAKLPASADGPELFPTISAAHVGTLPPMQWLVRNYLPRAELAMLFGQSGSGKSFLAFDLAASVVRGEPWWGNRAQRGRVLYVVLEGQGGNRQRVEAYCKARGVDEGALRDLVFCMGSPNLFDPKDAEKLVHTARAAWGGGRPNVDLVVIDTLARAVVGANENSGEDMGRVLRHCQEIHRALGAIVLLVHHSGKDEARGARGWSGLRAACDAELEITIDSAGRTLRVSKMKDGEDGMPRRFELRRHVLGVNEDLGEISSMTVEPVPEAPKSSESVRLEKQVKEIADRRRLLGKNEKAVLWALETKRMDGGLEKDILDTLAAERMPESPAWKARGAYRDALCSLETKGVVRRDAGVVRLMTPGERGVEGAEREPPDVPLVPPAMPRRDPNAPMESPDGGAGVEAEAML